jgi:RNA polymerase sigma-70 factor
MKPGVSGGSAESLVERSLRVGRAAWPELAVDEAALSAHLSERLPGGGDGVLDETLADLYLACACLTAAPGAIEAFTRVHLARVQGLTRSYDPSAAFADEVAQQVRTKLFVGEGRSPPKIVQYRGEGPLGAWVRVAIVRAAQRLSADRQRNERPVEEALAEAIAWSNNGEVLLLRAELRQAFQRAFREAVRQLPRNLRMALKLNVVKRVSTTAIAKLNGVDQSTISRWLAEARRQLRAATRSAMADSLQLSPSDIDSVLTVLDNQVDLQLSQLLATSGTSFDGGGGG